MHNLTGEGVKLNGVPVARAFCADSQDDQQGAELTAHPPTILQTSAHSKTDDAEGR